jgi:hypothetical protein
MTTNAIRFGAGQVCDRRRRKSPSQQVSHPGEGGPSTMNNSTTETDELKARVLGLIRTIRRGMKTPAVYINPNAPAHIKDFFDCFFADVPRVSANYVVETFGGFIDEGPAIADYAAVLAMRRRVGPPELFFANFVDAELERPQHDERNPSQSRTPNRTSCPTASPRRGKASGAHPPYNDTTGKEIS